MLLFVTAVTILIVPVLGGYVGDQCYDGDNQGKCTLLSQCQPLMDEIRAAGNPMPLHMNSRLTRVGCGYIGNEPLACCLSGPSLRAPTNPNPDETDHVNLSLLPRDCGIAEGDKIFGGSTTKLFEMPWMVLLSADVDGIQTFSCGGTLITNRYVLTAAHCLLFEKRMRLTGVILGEHDVTTDPDCEVFAGNKSCAATVVNATIEDTIIHLKYENQTRVNDIALIRLGEPANFSSDSISPICLPLTRELQLENLDGKFGEVAGWGLTEIKYNSPVLLKVSLPIIHNEECQLKYNGTLIGGQICAGGEAGKDSCSKDSGGPLTYPGQVASGKVRTVQRGIVSVGPTACGQAGMPAIYTRVSHYINWILDNIRG